MSGNFDDGVAWGQLFSVHAAMMRRLEETLQRPSTRFRTVNLKRYCGFRGQPITGCVSAISQMPAC